MDTKKTAIVRFVVDITLIIIVGLAVLLLSLLGHPFHRGFYCQDTSVRFPYHTSTVSTLAAALGALLIPISLFAVFECASKRGRTPTSGVICLGRAPPRGVVRWLKLSGVFLFGAGVEQIIVDVAKYMIGRLRPHFLAVCNPDFKCSADTTYDYILNYKCMAEDTAMIEEARLSFPSGHASISFYGAVFTIMYLQCTFNCPKSRLLKHLLQLLVLLAAWFTALSRVTDYHHHWSDVLAGIIIGALVATLTVIFITDLQLQYSMNNKHNEMVLTARDSDNRITPTISSYAPQDSLQTTELIV